MSNAQAIAAVTASLRQLLIEDLAADPVLTGFAVSTKALANATQDTGNRINLFLYEIRPSQCVHDLAVDRGRRPGEPGRPPVALVLRYLVTAFGQDDDEIAAHRLLGRAIAAFHDRPVLERSLIREALGEANLHRQVEPVRVTPLPVSSDEVSKVWSTFEAGYRVSVAFEVSLVLIESERSDATGPPVLAIGEDDRGVDVRASATVPAIGPLLQAASTAGEETTIELGEELVLEGAGLGGASAVLIADAAGVAVHELVPDPGSGDDRIAVAIPPDGLTDGTPWAAGIHTARAIVAGLDTNRVALALAPRIDAIEPPSSQSGDVVYTVQASPPVALAQSALLLLAGNALRARPRTDPSAPLVFDARGLTAGSYPARLRVDGVDSRVVDRTSMPPTFLPGALLEVT